MSPPTPPEPAPRRPWLLPVVIALGVLLHAPSLATGFYADDHMHQLALDGKLPLSPWALFDFGTAADWAPFRETLGGFPWWTSPDWKIRFFRPLASASLALDHALFGSAPAAHHAVSLAWYAALLGVTYVAGRVLGMSRGLAVAAAALLATSQATVHPVGWLANRNSLLAATFTTAAVAAIASHARLGRGRALAAALVLATCACLSKESGIVAFGAVAAWLVVMDHGLPATWARRAAAASVACAVLHVGALAVAGFGTRSAFYATPWADPGRFVANLGRLATTGVLALLTPVMSDLTFVLPEAGPALAVAGLVVGVPTAVWMFRRLRDAPSDVAAAATPPATPGGRTAAFLAVWAAMAIVPEAGAPLQDRLLLSATIPVSALLALLLARTLPRAAERRPAERIAAWTIVVFAAIEALATAGTAASLVEMAATTREKVLATDVGPASLGRREVVVLQGDDPLVIFAMPATWAFQSGDLDVRFTPVQTGRRGLRWTRIDAHTMEFESLDQPFVTYPFETVYRSGTDAPAAGTTTALPGIRFDVVAVAPEGGVRTFRMTFDTPPDGERFRFVVPKDGRLTRVLPPAPGETVTIPQAAKAHPFMP